jgi:hypothetical protein
MKNCRLSDFKITVLFLEIKREQCSYMVKNKENLSFTVKSTENQISELFGEGKIHLMLDMYYT